MAETYEQLLARVNGLSFIPLPDPTGVRTMAKQVKLVKGKEFQFNASLGRTETKYAWDEWFNGHLLLLERSSGSENDKGTIVDVSEKRDYEVPTDAMPPKIKTAARRRYKVVQVSRVDADGTKLKDALIIKARDMNADERQDEDILRAEEKAELKDKKAAKRNAVASTNGAAHTEAPVAAEVA